MAAGEVVEVTATADETTVTVTMTGAGVNVTAPTTSPALPGATVLSVPDSMMSHGGLAVTIPVEE